LRYSNGKSRRTFDAKTASKVIAPTYLSGTAYVVDGDTITLKGTQIRLFGIDAPELDHPFGQKAKWALVSFCKGQTIRAEITHEDGHGRVVARCFLPNGDDLSAKMVLSGLAIDWAKFSGGEYAALEQPNVRKKLWLADARQRGDMYLWERYSAQKNASTRSLEDN